MQGDKLKNARISNNFDTIAVLLCIKRVSFLSTIFVTFSFC